MKFTLCDILQFTRFATFMVVKIQVEVFWVVTPW